MAELEYEFTESGLSDLRDSMSDLAEDTEDVGDRAEDASSDLEDMADDGVDATGDLEQSTADVQDALQALSDEATGTGAALERGLDTDPVDQLDTAVVDLEGQFESLATSAQIDTSVFSDLEQRADAVRSALEDLAGTDVSLEQVDTGPLENVSVLAEDASSDLADMADTDLSALPDGMDAAEESIVDVGGAAQDAAEDIQRQFGDASDQALEDLTGLQERLEGLEDFELDVGGEITADITSQLEDLDVGGSGLTGLALTINAIQGLSTGLNLSSLEEDLEAEKAKNEVEDLAESIRDLQERIDDIVSGRVTGGPEDIENMEAQIEDLKSQLEDAIRKAKELDESLTLQDLPLDDIEIDIMGILDPPGPRERGGGMEDTKEDLEDVEESAEDAEQDVGFLQSTLNSLGEAVGLGPVADKIRRIGRSSDDAEEDVNNLREDLNDLGEAAGLGSTGDKLSGLGGDDGGIGGGIGFALGRFGSAASSAGSILRSFIGTATGAATAIGTVGTAAAAGTKQMADFAAQVAETGQQLEVAESQSGVAAAEVQELFLVAQRLDSTVDLDAIRDAFKELALRTEEAREGSGEAKEAFERLGISMEELEGLSTAEVFRRVRREASQLTAQQRALTLEQVAGGEAGERLARVFGLTADEFQRLKEATADDALTSAQIEALDEMRSEYTGAVQDLESIKQQLTVTFGGPAISLFSTFTSAFQRFVLQKLLRARAVLNAIQGGPSQIQQPTFGENQNTIDFSDDGGEVEEPLQRMNEALEQMETRIAVAREKMNRGLINEEQMVRRIQSARQTAADELLKLEQQSPDLIPDSKVDQAIAKLKRIQRRLNQLTSGEEVSFDVETEQVTPTPQEQLPTPSLPSPSIEGLGGGLSALQGAADAADSVGDINSLIEATRSQFDLLNNDEAQAFVANLQKAKAEMKENQREAAAIGDALERSVARSADRLFQSIGDAFAGAIFGGGGGPGEAQSRLDLFNAREQMRTLRQSLQQGQISFREFQLRVRVQQRRIQARQEQLNEAMDSGFVDAAESMLSAFKQIAQQLIAEITAVIAKMAVLKLLVDGFSIGSGGFLGGVISNLGGGVFFDSGATGGSVESSGLAEIHQDENIVPASTVETLSTLTTDLQSLTRPATPTAQTAAAGAGMNITVQVEGQTTTDGRDLKTAYDTTTRVERRKGRA